MALRRPLVRLTPGGDEPTPIKPPLRVLLLIAAPPNADEGHRVDVESERAIVEAATREMREAGQLHLLVEEIATERQVRQTLLRFRPHVLHFVGYGGYREGTGGYVEWEDERGQPDPRFRRAAGRPAAPARPARRLSSIAATPGAATPAASGAAWRRRWSARASPWCWRSRRSSATTPASAPARCSTPSLSAGLGLAEAAWEVRQALRDAGRPDWASPLLHATAGGLAPLLDSATPPGEPDPAWSSAAPPPTYPRPRAFSWGGSGSCATCAPCWKARRGAAPSWR